MTRTRNTPITTELDLLAMRAGGESFSEKSARFEASVAADAIDPPRRRIGAMLHALARWIEGSGQAAISAR